MPEAANALVELAALSHPVVVAAAPAPATTNKIYSKTQNSPGCKNRVSLIRPLAKVSFREWF